VVLRRTGDPRGVANNSTHTKRRRPVSIQLILVFGLRRTAEASQERPKFVLVLVLVVVLELPSGGSEAFLPSPDDETLSG